MPILTLSMELALMAEFFNVLPPAEANATTSDPHPPN